MTILIADDERTIRQGIVAAIDWASLGIDTVLEASNGQEAYNIIKNESPDIAIMDIMMPDMTGMQVISAFKNDSSAPKFILLSGYSQFDYAQEAIRNNVVDYLLKPCNVEEITSLLASVIQKLETAEQKQNDFLAALEDLDEKTRLRLIRSYMSDDAIRSVGGLKNTEEEKYSPPVVKALAYIRENLSDTTLSSSKIAREVLFLNPDYFGKLFKKEVGERFSHVLMAVRIGEAMKLISQHGNQLKIYEVADRVGLGENVAYFSHAFKKMSGVLPSQYAKNSFCSQKLTE